MDKFKNKYRISTTRLQKWDYAWNGAYFVTICTKNRECYFGFIENGEMKLSAVGNLAEKFWYEITKHHTVVELEPFVVMPNHVHGILIINNDNANGDKTNIVNDTHNVETRHALSLQNQPHHDRHHENQPHHNYETNIQTTPHPPTPPQTIGQNRFQNQGKNTLSSIIGTYQSAVTRHARRLGCEFGWQSRFYDHIIRDRQSYDRIRNYILITPPGNGLTTA